MIQVMYICSNIHDLWNTERHSMYFMYTNVLTKNKIKNKKM